MGKGFTFFAGAALLVAACTTTTTPSSPGSSANAGSAAATHAGHGMTSAMSPRDIHSAADADKGYIDGWFNGQQVQLYYTKSFVCENPPSSQATATGCELGADAESAPRPGPIPTIYAIAAVGGITPALSTLACAPGTVCLNHPAMIDASRVGGPANGPAVPHSHILTEQAGGWFHTVNIRVRNLDVWNQIAEAKHIDKVRELQNDPLIGMNSQNWQISADTPTNIFFFIASWRPVVE